MSDKMPKFKNFDDEAAYWLADLFAQAVIRKLEMGYRDLYMWEQGALDWLREYRKRAPEAFLNSWTQHYLDHGPPPWRH